MVELYEMAQLSLLQEQTNGQAGCSRVSGAAEDDDVDMDDGDEGMEDGEETADVPPCSSNEMCSF